ncbi:hypothetical protein DYD21_00160 [Rhodohalobacter sp. SW132]|uniref:hypothetical protein n=1 Tax=Rhodohalobacter sp. SW132 TaxID=2293433 RepID=UPI000E26E42F|nr:hypothetical protein [Rhodohalobacter sp. SW132]REL38405.1 hypothetical protein DYD21_00160 [Rhodohalobacter sp. SW132]
MRFKFLLLISITLILSVQQIFSQSIYTKQKGSSISAGFGLSANNSDLNGRSFALGMSPARGTDFSFTVSDFEGTFSGGYPYSFRNVGGSITFSPLKQWEDNPFSFQAIVGGTKTYSKEADVQRGLSAFMGAYVVRELQMEKASLYPGISYIYSPFVAGKPDQASSLAVDMGLSVELTRRLLFIVSPSLTFDLTHNTRSAGIISGFVF